MATTNLVSSSYTPPGVIIAEFLQPNPGILDATRRICDYIGKGSTYATVSNAGIIRAFVYSEAITLPRSAPFQYFLNHESTGSQAAPAMVYDTITGLQLTQAQWEFVKDTNGNYSSIILDPSAVSPTAAYAISYQSSDADVLDPLPVQGLRTIQAVGNVQNRAQYKDMVDYFIPYSFTSGAGAESNSSFFSSLTAIFADASNTGGGQFAIDDAASYDHNYNRFYQLTCTAASGAPGSQVASFQWSAQVYSGGSAALPPTPYNVAGIAPTFTVDQTDPQSLEQIQLELGIQVACSFPTGNFAVGDRFYFNGVGPGLIEFNSTLLNSNQYAELGTISSTLQFGSTGSISFAPTAAYTGIYNSSFALQVVSASGSVGARTVTFSWAQYGDLIGPTGSFTLNEASSTSQLLTQGAIVEVNFGATNFAAGDTFSFSALAPKTFYMAKDDRVLTLTISQPSNPGADTGLVTGSYATGTPEGGFGSFTAQMNNLFGTNQQTGLIALPDNLGMFCRNMMQGNINGTSYATGDSFTPTVTSEGVIDWSLTKKTSETRELSGINTDVTGAITGVPGSYYIILSNIFIDGTVAISYLDSPAEISFMEIPGTKFIAFLTKPTAAIDVDYQYSGNQPIPSQTYFFTGNYLRPSSLYNSPTQILSVQDGRTLLAPAASDNHLYIMNELVFANAAPGAYYTQPFNNDGSGNLSTTDVEAALQAHAGVNNATDLCLLSLFDSLSDALEINETSNDPFQKREQMLWVGAPIGTPIGDDQTPDTLVYLATNTMQTSPSSDAQGTRVLVAPTSCSINLLLPNGVTQSVTLDGSFVAGAMSALVNSFEDPAATVLRKNLSGFTGMQTYTAPQNNLLGGASITYLSDQGNNVFRFEEDITTSTLSEEFQNINITTQKQYVTRVVRNDMDAAVISVVAPSAQAAIALIRADLSEILIGLHSTGILADWQDDNGNVRQFDADSDIAVLRVSGSLTSYNFWFAYYTRNTIKRLYGLYVVNNSLSAVGAGQ